MSHFFPEAIKVYFKSLRDASTRAKNQTETVHRKRCRRNSSIARVIIFFHLIPKLAVDSPYKSIDRYNSGYKISTGKNHSEHKSIEATLVNG